MSAHMLTIGHSRHPLDVFLQLLARYDVELLADVRSVPQSRFSPQFGRKQLEAAVAATGRSYLFLGKELGGRPDGASFYDDDGHVLYGRRARSAEFLDGVRRLEAELPGRRVAILCSEENPAHCHRRLLVGRVLGAQGVAIDHIRGDGRLEPESELAREAGRQGTLFGAGDDDTWRSTHPVRPPAHAPARAPAHRVARRK
jgi:uncharacterized protein (DUF488 family)